MRVFLVLSFCVACCAGDVEVHSGIPYLADSIDKHKLDLYLPAGKSNFPVVVFIHGGGWRIGDRSQYKAVGHRLAEEGIGVAIPSYRLMGIKENPHPAQMEDAAAAFAWVRAHIGEYGGDAKRMYVAGHSSGGHMAALLALDPRYLAREHLDAAEIRGVVSVSGVYNVDHLVTFHTEGKRSGASPMRCVNSSAPPFLLVNCQWDYIGLPKQAKQFAAALRDAGVRVETLQIRGENHIHEIFSSLLTDRVVSFVR